MKRRAKSVQPSSTAGTTASQQVRWRWRRRRALPSAVARRPHPPHRGGGGGGGPADLKKNLDVVGDIDSRIRRHTNGNERVKANQ